MPKRRTRTRSSVRRHPARRDTCKAGDYKVEVAAGSETKSITWNVYGTPEQAKAKNVIFLIADGLSVAHRTAARIMSKA